MTKRKINRGLGYIYRPKYRDHRTGDWIESSHWWVQVRYRGKRYRVNSRSSNRTDAVALLNKLKGEMSKGRLVTPSIERTKFSDLKAMLFTDYKVNGRKSFETAKGSMKALEKYFGDEYARDITLDRLNAYVEARMEADRKPATIQNALSAVTDGGSVVIGDSSRYSCKTG